MTTKWKGGIRLVDFVGSDEEALHQKALFV